MSFVLESGNEIPRAANATRGIIHYTRLAVGRIAGNAPELE
jgi:hypothetical protein